MQVEIKELKKEIELQHIEEMARQIWPRVYHSLLSPAQIRYMLDETYSPAALKNQFRAGHHFLILYADQVQAGYSAFEFKENQTFIHKIYVNPEKQGLGLGKTLIRYIAEESLRHSISTLQLRVNRKNKALGFYQKIGFVIQRAIDTPIGNGFFMNDYLMEKSL